MILSGASGKHKMNTVLVQLMLQFLQCREYVGLELYYLVVRLVCEVHN